ncbi:MAG: glycosyltransferase family 1 protein [Chitinophagaceae bacterium]|nr:MAG: glycosyltransferase family 1 protein [Chitinophagaceae bacterium]
MQNSTRPKKLIRITTVPMALRYLLPGQMSYMSNNGYEVVMISADGKELPDVIEQEQCRHIKVPMTRKITPFQDLKCLWQLIKIFRRERPDIVHSHTPKAGLLGMLAARIAGVKTRVHTVAGLPMMVEKGLKFRLLKSLEKITYAASSHVWPNSESLFQYIIKQKLTNLGKLNIIGGGSTNGINTDRFNTEKLDPIKMQQVKAGIGYSADNTYLLSIGRLVKDKGIVETVNVFTGLYKENSSLRLILVGDFEEELDPLPADTIHTIKNCDAIIHISWTNDVEYYMQLADNFIFASHREGFPNVLLQAGAMKLPVICSRITGNVDIVKQNETGLIFEPGNERQLQQLIKYAMSHKQVILGMAQTLKDKVVTEYQRSYIWQKISDQYAIISVPARSTPGVFQQLNKIAADFVKQPSMLWEYFVLSIQLRRLSKRTS